MTVAKFVLAFDRFQNVPVCVPFSKSTVTFSTSVGKNVPFSCEREVYPSHFHRLCEWSLKFTTWFLLKSGSNPDQINKI